VENLKQGNPLDTETQVGAQASNDQLEKILSYLDIGRQEGAKVRTGGGRAELGGNLALRTGEETTADGDRPDEITRTGEDDGARTAQVPHVVYSRAGATRPTPSSESEDHR
jgi:hypothetical protein